MLPLQPGLGIYLCRRLQGRPAVALGESPSERGKAGEAHLTGIFRLSILLAVNAGEC